MVIKLPKVDKKTYSFRLFNPVMDDVYLYCKNSNIQVGDYINNLLKEDMKGRVLKRTDNNNILFLSLPIEDETYDYALTNRTNLCVAVSKSEKESNTTALNILKNNEIMGAGIVIKVHPNNYLDLFINGTYQAATGENSHEGIITYSYKNIDYNILIQNKKGLEYTARLIDNDTVIEKLQIAGYDKILDEMIEQLNQQKGIQLLLNSSDTVITTSSEEIDPRDILSDEDLAEVEVMASNIKKVFDENESLKVEVEDLKKELNYIKSNLELEAKKAVKGEVEKILIEHNIDYTSNDNEFNDYDYNTNSENEDLD